jgi:hypothetical protein
MIESDLHDILFYIINKRIVLRQFQRRMRNFGFTGNKDHRNRISCMIDREQVNE